jgi:hypothetical protein
MIEDVAQGFGRWSEPGLPHKGWTCVDESDLGEPSHVCEMCQTASVRYVYAMRHPEWPETLWVGCVCAGHMEGDLRAAVEREKRFKSMLRLAAKRPRDATWVKAADQILASRLSEKERSFVNDMRQRFVRRRRFQPTPKQQGWFVAIYKRVVPKEEWQREAEAV